MAAPVAYAGHLGMVERAMQAVSDVMTFTEDLTFIDESPGSRAFTGEAFGGHFGFVCHCDDRNRDTLSIAVMSDSDSSAGPASELMIYLEGAILLAGASPLCRHPQFDLFYALPCERVMEARSAIGIDSALPLLTIFSSIVCPQGTTASTCQPVSMPDPSLQNAFSYTVDRHGETRKE